MFVRRLLLSLIAALLGVVALPLLAAPAQAATEVNSAVAPSGQRGSGPCTEAIGGAWGCYQANGDYWWVYDTRADGHSAVVEWDLPEFGRQGQCWNRLGSGHAGVCNKNYPELYAGGFRVCVRDWTTKEYFGCSEWRQYNTT